jgi:hypothetical protein
MLDIIDVTECKFPRVPCSLELSRHASTSHQQCTNNVLAQETSECLIILTSGRGLCTITWFSAKSTSHACLCKRPKGTVRGPEFSQPFRWQHGRCSFLQWLPHQFPQHRLWFAGHFSDREITYTLPCL